MSADEYRIPDAANCAEILWDVCQKYDRGERAAIDRYADQMAAEYQRVYQAGRDDRPTYTWLVVVAIAVAAAAAAFLVSGAFQLEAARVAGGAALGAVALVLVTAADVIRGHSPWTR